MNFTNSQHYVKDLPEISSLDLKSVSKAYFKIIAFNRVIVYVILVSIAFLLRLLIKEDGFTYFFWYGFLILILVLLLDFIITALAFKKRKYALREHDIIYSKGLLFFSVTTVPVNRIQHTEVSQSWLERKLKLASLKIYTAGESGGDLRINGLPTDSANAINNYISRKINGND